ncbi:hypothetical protein [Erythrobacter litoralis]|uniref:Uncharacterized protein n=1 Tax=Erythrobacter litoralis (strain HTCC2594) TaxID=314225 RepID=Q2N9J8_ERYLH|nr:hypothetical protein [Erythrobacter litoralis]ABC63643.1 hypothetical protein ELI_07755 [Erythrobacter litoralis HTCC2594]
MTNIVKEYWFYWLLPLWLLAAWQVSAGTPTEVDPRLTERIYLFDFGLFLPLLYFAYLRTRVPLKAAILRSLGIGAAGIAFAAWLMPDGSGEILPWLGWLRWTALPLIIAIELAAFVALIRYLYGEAPQEDRLIEQGIPPVIVKLMLAEARFWKRVYRLLTGRKD